MPCLDNKAVVVVVVIILLRRFADSSEKWPAISKPSFDCLEFGNDATADAVAVDAVAAALAEEDAVVVAVG